MCTIQNEISMLGFSIDNIEATIKAISNEIELDWNSEENTQDSNNLSVDENEPMYEEL